jgi:N-acetylglucosamine-6-sulfatase
VFIDKAIPISLAAFAVFSFILLPPLAVDFAGGVAFADNHIQIASVDSGGVPSLLEVSEIRSYNYTEDSIPDLHTGETQLSSVSNGIPFVINGIVRNLDYTAEHFDYITEVFDSRGIVVYLDVRYGVAVPLSGEIGIDSGAPIELDEPGTYTLKIFTWSNVDQSPVPLSSGALGTIVVQQQNSTADEQPKVPNIVVIMADDLDEHSLDILLNAGLMPNLKKHIIDQGVNFSEAFFSFPLCCPSRATFLTGQYPHNHNVWANSLPNGGVSKLDDSSTLPIWLQDAGYYTANVGKYLNSYGIDTEETYIPPGWNDWQTTVGSSTYWMYGYTFNDNGVLVKYGDAASDYQTDVVSKRSVEVITERESSDSTPFFLYINPLAPHEDGKTTACNLNYGDIKTTRAAPRHIGATADIDFLESMPPSFNEEDVSDKPNKYHYAPLNDVQIGCLDELFHARLDSMLAVDDLIGDVATALDNNNERNTILVFTSDNGFLLGEHRLHAKQHIYEQSIRQPLYMRIPQVAPQTIDRLVTNNDLAPTFLEFAGAKAGIEMDGRSLVPLINDPSISWRNGILIEVEAYSAIRTENYVYASHYSGAREIYDLNNDPYELENLAGVRDWRLKIEALELWRAALVDCAGVSCQNVEDRTAP